MKFQYQNAGKIAAALSALAMLTSPAWAQNAAPTVALAAPTQLQQVVVTGTMLEGVTEENSATPILVLPAATLQHAGTQNLGYALQQTVPGFFMTQVGGDLADITRSADLLGLDPNDTLVMVNGKRRHDTAMINADGQGESAPDLSFIPAAALENTQVLRIGDATLYGTDAIAGVVNLILKHSRSGGSLSLTGGQYYDSGPLGKNGQSYDFAVNKGLPLGKNGFIDITFAYTHRNYDQVGGADSKLVTFQGAPISSPYSAIAKTIPGYPYLNGIDGTPRVNQSALVVNSGYNFTPHLQFYDFGTYGTKLGQSFENWRPPNETVASPVLGVAGTYGTPGALVPYPEGFSPQEQISEVDFANTAGLKGTIAAWHWDLSTTYGQDRDAISTNHTIVRSLYVATHNSPNDFNDGVFAFSEWTDNLDVTRSFQMLGMPSNLAFGAELRNDTYTIEQGEALATYQEGPQGFPGYTAADAGTHKRENTGEYVDLVTFPVAGWQLEASGREEHYSDFGNALIGDFISRYDFSPKYALRVAAQSGFRAPTLQEEYYTATNVDPNYADVVLPANSSATRVLGYPALKPLRSVEFSAGLVMHPIPALAMTIDAYLLRIDGNITNSPTLYCKGGASNTPLVCDAITNNGNVIDPTAGDIEARTFINGYDSKTEGVEWSVDYPTPLGRFGMVQWTFNGDYHDTSVVGVSATPAVLLPIQLFQPFNVQNLDDDYSKYTIKLGGVWTLRKWSATLWEEAYGPTTFLDTITGGAPFYPNHLPATLLTDLELDYQVTQSLKLDVGARNLFNKRPPWAPVRANGKPDQNANSEYGLVTSPYDPGGGYWYAGLTVQF